MYFGRIPSIDIVDDPPQMSQLKSTFSKHIEYYRIFIYFRELIQQKTQRKDFSRDFNLEKFYKRP